MLLKSGGGANTLRPPLQKVGGMYPVQPAVQLVIDACA